MRHEGNFMWRHFDKIFIAAFLLIIALWIIGGYVGWHFIKKFW